MPDYFRLKARRGQSEGEAISMAALGLLKKQGLLDQDLKRSIDQQAIMAECVRIVGAEKARTVVMPPEWASLPKKGQSMKEATHGAAMVLLQRHGLIDLKDENKVAMRYRHALLRKRRQDGNRAEKQKQKKPKGDGGNKT
jgi:hypothetical protein